MKITMRWGSHIPVLLKLLEHTTGNVLELGMGLYSTPLLFWACVSQDRDLVSYENYEKYLNLFGKNNNTHHETHLIADWTTIDLSRHFDIGIIDVNPMEFRSYLAVRIEDLVDYIVLHDSNPKEDNFYHYSGIYSRFKYRFDYNIFNPHTTVISKMCSLEFLNDLKILQK
jgi:hypothetical protein